MRRLLIITFGLMVCLMLSSNKIEATATTHIWGPSTDVQGFNLWHLTADCYIASEGDEEGNQIAPVTNLGLTVGVLPFEKLNMEIGFDHKSGLGLADDYPIYGNLKIGIPENAFGSYFPAIAAGIYDAGTKSDMTDYNILYAKIGQSMKLGEIDCGRISIGFFSGNDELLLDKDGEKDNQGIMVAWERTLTEISDKLWICFEYMGTESSYGCANAGVSWKFAPNVGVLAGYTMYNNDALADTFTLQVDIDF